MNKLPVETRVAVAAQFGYYLIPADLLEEIVAELDDQSGGCPGGIWDRLKVIAPELVAEYE